MFPRRFFGATFYNPHYFGGGSDTLPPEPEYSTEDYWVRVIGGRMVGG